jgi:hypothetical protein
MHLMCRRYQEVGTSLCPFALILHLPNIYEQGRLQVSEAPHASRRIRRRPGARGVGCGNRGRQVDSVGAWAALRSSGNGRSGAVAAWRALRGRVAQASLSMPGHCSSGPAARLNIQ